MSDWKWPCSGTSLDLDGLALTASLSTHASAPRRLRVGFDARMIENSGIGRYIQNLLPRLPDQGVDVIAWMLPEQATDPRWAFDGVERRELDAKIFSISEQRAVGRAAQEARIDLLHIPHLNAPLLCRVPMVVTIHDLIPFFYPEAIAARFGGVYFHAMARLTPRRAQRVLTVSEHTRRDLIAHTGADPTKITSIPLAVDDVFSEPATLKVRRSVRERFGLTGRYLLYAGQWKTYKNVDLLLDVMQHLDPDRFPDLKLVLVGKEDPRVPMRETLSRRGIQDRVAITGYLSDQELVALYQEATIFAFPSRYEGFGLPPLEAMAAGIPVIASDRASLPEVVGDAGLILSPDSMLEWLQAVESLCQDPARHQALSSLGSARAAMFRWDRVAERTVDAYRQVIGRS